MPSGIDAGDFGAWLIQAHEVLRGSAASQVPCGDCTGCCTSSYSIEIRPADAALLPQIPAASLFRSLGSAAGNWTVRPNADGTCPMLECDRCSIYRQRPQTCRDYDCRVFAAAGIAAGDADKAVINRRVREWRFQFSTAADRQSHAAIEAAAAFIIAERNQFPPGTAPLNPLGVAALALRVYSVFLPPGPPNSAADTACAVSAAAAAFDRPALRSPRMTEFTGGCTCRAVRYRLTDRPMFIHCCHCRWCQRESGASFALNALLESDRVELLSGDVAIIDTPSNSGKGQRISRCPTCHIALWSNYGGGGDVIRFVRVGTLDEPDRCPPDVHIFTASRQPWVILPAAVPAFAEYYERTQVWPAASLARRAAALARAAK